jgi:predicted TIM-barrel fold metal-dependent hydrolase
MGRKELVNMKPAFAVPRPGGRLRKWFAAAETLLAGLSADEKAAIFGGNAARIYL